MQKELENDWGVSPTTINDIVNCKHWTTEHLSDE